MGKRVVAQIPVVRACGCAHEFMSYEGDRHRDQRLARFRATRCAACAARHAAEQRQAAQAQPKKGEVLRSLPPGTRVTMTRGPDGTWSGTLDADGTAVGAVGDGPQGLAVTLARLWLASRADGATPGAAPD